jgi:acyl-CoA reductase-like NAD-dependent aldehyde dehydrogenase
VASTTYDVSRRRTPPDRGAAGVFTWYAEAIDELNDEVAPTGPGALAIVRREPLGAVGAVVPWALPLDVAAWKLAAVNSVVLEGGLEWFPAGTVVVLVGRCRA